MFDFNLIKGNRKQFLKSLTVLCLLKQVRKNYSGTANPLEKQFHIMVRDTMNLIVTGVMENVPQNSQLQFDALVSFNTIYRPDWMNNWGGNWLDTYFELAPNTNVAALEKKFPALLKKIHGRWRQLEKL
jgi:putative ABC transport system permease protein